MPSPDLRKYVDLTLYDEDSQRIYLNALNYARVALPEFRPREGSIELILLQALAVEVASLSRAINRLPGGIVQILLQLYGISRSEAQLPTAVVRFNAVDTQSYSVPIGSRVYYQPSADFEPLVMTTDLAVTLTHAKNVLTIVAASGTATVTTSERHGFVDSQEITVAGVASPDTDLNGTFTITYIDQYSFSYTTTNSDVSLTFNGTVSATPPASHPSSGFVTATGTVGTAVYNGLAAGTTLDLLSGLRFIASSYLHEAISGGQEAESDDDYLARATGQFARMSRTLVTADGYIQWALQGVEFPYVYRATAVEGTGTIRLIVAPIDASSSNLLTGVGDAAVLTDSSDPSWGQKDEIRVAAQEISHAAAVVTVADPQLVTVTVSSTVKPLEGVSGAAMQTAIVNVLDQYLSPNRWDWDTGIRKNEIIGLISGTTLDNGERAVDYVSDLTISITGVVPEPYTSVETSDSTPSWATGTLTVTHTGHGMSASNTNYVALDIGGSWTVYEATISSVDEFTVEIAADPGLSAAVDWILVGSVSATGDLTISDDAPLVISGAHTVAVL